MRNHSFSQILALVILSILFNIECSYARRPVVPSSTTSLGALFAQAHVRIHCCASVRDLLAHVGCASGEAERGTAGPWAAGTARGARLVNAAACRDAPGAP